MSLNSHLLTLAVSKLSTYDEQRNTRSEL